MHKLLFVCLLITNFAISQNNECGRHHVGNFIIKDPNLGDSYIKRTKKYQIEKSLDIKTGKKVKAKAQVVWIDECSYKLIPIKAKNDEGLIRNDPIVFTFIETNKEYYVVEISGLSRDIPSVKVYVR